MGSIAGLLHIHLDSDPLGYGIEAFERNFLEAPELLCGVTVWIDRRLSFSISTAVHAGSRICVKNVRQCHCSDRSGGVYSDFGV